MKNSTSERLQLIAQIIYDKKGSNILALDVQGLSNITDYVILAEGNVDRHVISIAKAIMEGLKEIGCPAAHAEGLQTGDWVVIDFCGIMVHLFMPGLREKYALEKLWPQSSIVDLKIDLSAPKAVPH